MKTLFRLLIVAGFIALGTPALLAQLGSSQFFLNIPGIAGESTATGHVGQIDVISFKLGVSQRGISDFGGGGGAGKSTFLPVTVFKNTDLASPALFLACATGKHIPKVELHAARPGSNGLQTYLVLTLSDVLVSSVNNEAADTNGFESVLESVSLNFAKIEISYRPENADHVLGAEVKSGFDVKLNKRL